MADDRESGKGPSSEEKKARFYPPRLPGEQKRQPRRAPAPKARRGDRLYGMLSFALAFVAGFSAVMCLSVAARSVKTARLNREMSALHAEYSAKETEEPRNAVERLDPALLAGAQTPEARAEAWQTVRLLWQAALDGETHARLSATDDAGREALEADQAAFAGWLEARAALLDLAYPDRPDIVNEILARAVRSRVAALCAK